MLFLYLNLIILVADGLTSAIEDPIVSLKAGLIRGKSHGHYYSFEGIPYAEPPTGENRFKASVPYLRSWSNIVDATKLHESCIRLDPMETNNRSSQAVLIGSEDCLYLNIYTPDIENYKLYPVLFYIHGGGFMFGSGDDLRENILMEHQNMILVTFNYRLGPLGFLSTGDEEISGNMGLKDQRLALKWIKENIRSFNGNPDEILLSGFSAGGSSVELHLLQPGIENYANAAISFSGSAFCPWAMVQEPLKDAIKMADILKCRDNKNDVITTKQIKECLIKMPASEIVLAVQKYQSFLYNPIRVFGPVIESKKVKNAFITDTPTNLIKKGILSKVPWIAGNTAQDGALVIANLMQLPEDVGNQIREEFNKDPKKILALMLFLDENKNENDIKQDMEMLWKKYDLPEKFTKNDYEKFTKISTDIMIKDKINESLKLHGEFGNGSTYGYLYDNPAVFGWGHFISGNKKMNFGTLHGDDVFLILNYPPRDLTQYPLREDEKENSKKFINMLEKYARTGIAQFGNFYLEAIRPTNNKIAKITGKSISMVEF